ncbi:MAG: DNA topology modulation protein FlaR [Bacilli bacterium]
MKIYIIGSTGAGKTYLSKKLSEKYNMKAYELDRIVYDQNNLSVHRSDKEIEKDFNKIINSSSWIIEDIGRKRFIKGREKADRIYYIKISLLKNYKQMIKRWNNQRKGLEKYNIKPTIKNLLKQLNDINSYKKLEKDLLKELEIYKGKLEIIKR